MRIRWHRLFRFLSILLLVQMVTVIMYLITTSNVMITDDFVPANRSLSSLRTRPDDITPTQESRWNGCRVNQMHGKLSEIAEHAAVDPLRLSLTAKRCEETFQLYFRYLPKPAINRFCQKFGISNLTSPLLTDQRRTLQYKFMYCTGLMLYRFFLDSEGNVHMPKPFHNCKKMSFRDSGVPTLLVSFPGSGNSWVRQLLESTTGIYTGSDNDCDIDYIKNGMLGEGITSENVIAIKFHWGAPPDWPVKKIIYVIRNPYDALVAEYKRQSAADKFKMDTNISVNPHQFELDANKFGNNKDWRKFINNSAGKWKKHINRWLNSRLSNTYTILVVKFENLLTNLRAELKRMMDFLGYPYTEEELDCTINSGTNSFRRNHDNYKDVDHYIQTDIDLVYDEIKQVDKVLKKYNISYNKMS